MLRIGLEKGVRVDGREFPKPARSPECASGCRVGGCRRRVLRPRRRSGFRLLWTLGLGGFRAAGLADGHLLFRGDRRRGRRRGHPERGHGRFLAVQAAQGRSARRRGARPARRERLRARDRRPVGHGLLQRDGHDLARRGEPDHRLERRRGVRPRGGKLSQPRGRARRHQGRSRPAVPAAFDPRRQRRRRRVLTRRAAAPDRRTQVGRPGGRERSARGAGANRRLVPQPGSAACQGPVDRSGRRSRRACDGRDGERRIPVRSRRSAKRR